MNRLPVSLVLVSDYEPGEKSWNDERAALAAYLDDPNGVPDEVVIMESCSGAAGSPEIPDDIVALSPWVKVFFENTTFSAELKDAALQHCAHDLVAVAEADCLPLPGWLASLADEMDRVDGYAAVSGRTIYRGDTSLMRVLSLLDRGFMEVPHSGKYIHVSNNGALYRRELLQRHRYPADEPSPFVSAEIRLEDMLSAGARFGIRPDAVMYHAYGGIKFIFDLRRNKGYQSAIVFNDGRPRSRPVALLNAIRRTMHDDWRTVRKVSGLYLRWYDWPLLAAIFLAVRIPELAGAWHASGASEEFAATTAYR